MSMPRRVALVVFTFVPLLIVAATYAAAQPIDGAGAAPHGLDPGPIYEAGVSPHALSAETVSTEISYQGLLADSSGQPLGGSHDFAFQLWDAPEGGAQVGTDIVRNGVEVHDGVFTVSLALDADNLGGQALWLRLRVDGEWLSPRQALQAVPYALTLRPGALIQHESTAPALRVMNDGLGAGIRARGSTVGLDAEGMTGVQGQGDIGVKGVGPVGVRGESGQGVGVEGESINGHGVEGYSHMDIGVYGRTSGGFGSGVGGFGPTGVFGWGGVAGVSGYSPAENAIGVMGTVTGTDSVGVSGSSLLGVGVEGSGEVGVRGTGTVAAGVWGTGTVGVRGETGIGDGVSGASSGGTESAAVRGEATGLGYGGRFESLQAIGVFAKGYEGVHGEDVSGTHPGVHGTSRNVGVLGEGVEGPGVRGLSTTNDGVVGRSDAPGKSGVYAYTAGTGNGLTARSDGGNGVFVSGAGGNGVHIGSVTGHGVHVDGAGSIGFDVAAASVGVQVYSATKEGVLVHSAGMDGIRVASAQWSGVWVESAGYDAIRVQSAGQDGVRVFDTVGRDYFHAGSNADPDFRVQKDGLVLTDRGYRCGDGAPSCLQTGSADVAERVNATGALEPGDVLEIDPARPDHFRLSRSAESKLVAGVVSTRPAIVLGVDGLSLEDDAASDERPALALVGRVPVKATAENGAIAVGDMLVTARLPGHAMRSANPAPGTIIGKALESLDRGTGTILVLLSPR